jgi:hypothetical protein
MPHLATAPGVARLRRAPRRESVSRMAQKPLSEDGGEAYSVVTRFPREQVARVMELATAAGMTRSEFIRQAVADAVGDAGDED